MWSMLCIPCKVQVAKGGGAKEGSRETCLHGKRRGAKEGVT